MGPRNVATHPVSGEIVKRGDLYQLRSERGDTWPIERVTFIMGGWGFDQDGTSRLPRPSVYDGTKRTVKGDALLITFLAGNPRRPVVQAGLRSIRSDAFLPSRHAKGTSVNRLAMRLQVRDEDTGEVNGAIEVELAQDDKATARVLVEESVEITVGTGNSKVVITVKDGTMTIAGRAVVEATQGTAKKLTNEDALPRIAGLLTDLVTPSTWLPAAPGSPPTINPGTLVAMQLEIQQLQQKVDTTSDLTGA